MGSGKTEWAINYMNENSDKLFIYVTPFIKEIENRIVPNCKNLNFKTGRDLHKFEDFKKQLLSGENIAITHECLRLVDTEVLNLLDCFEYTLILDEALNVVENVATNKNSLEYMKQNGLIEIDANEKITWISDEKGTDFEYFRKKSSSFNVYRTSEQTCVRIFPHELFTKFKNVYILTYMFFAQPMSNFLKIYDYKFECFELDANKNLKHHDGNFHNDLKSLINIYDGRLNDIGKKNTALCKNWYLRNKTKLNCLKNNTYNYFRNVQKAKASDIIWCTYSEFESEISGKGFSSSVLPCNARSTNDYESRANVAYLVNLFYNPIVNKHFFANNHNSPINEDLWALSEMIQFIWRSRIRKHESINLYIPSYRMRHLLQKYLDNNIKVAS